jgi:ABC-type glycerol-3-phosphate transport system permease component
MKPDTSVIVGRAVIYLLLGAAAALTLTPLIWLIAATTKGPDDLFSHTFFAPRVSNANSWPCLTRFPSGATW